MHCENCRAALESSADGCPGPELLAAGWLVMVVAALLAPALATLCGLAPGEEPGALLHAASTMAAASRIASPPGRRRAGVPARLPRPFPRLIVLA
jgi:hypothetical protein